MARIARRLRRWINFYPPFLGAGIRITHISADMRELDVEMKLHWWNRNYVATHYGGSLYSMTDPFYMLMLLENLGSEYMVWDKSATIRFRRPGRGTVYAQFRLTEPRLQELSAQLENEDKIEPHFTVLVRDERGETVAEVDKILYIRRKGTEGEDSGSQRALTDTRTDLAAFADLIREKKPR